MRGKSTIVINGKVYDAITGLPVAAPNPTAHPARSTEAITRPAVVKPSTVAQATKAHRAVHAKAAHRTTQKSVTLRRDVLKKPAAKTAVSAARRKPVVGHVQRSEQIRRFAPHPQPLVKAPAPANPTKKFNQEIKRPVSKPAAIIAQKHAMVQPKPAPQQKPVLSSRSLKEQLIAERLAQVETAPTKAKRTPRFKGGFLKRQPRTTSLLAASFAVMILGEYFTYLNMPGLSVRVAAAQAGVSASYPDYHPDGYRFDGPVAYAPGQVAINFQANGGTANYTVTEQKSSWDSQAVYDNIVAQVADDSYVTNSQQGLTIYTFKGNAAWVNKGILYTIKGDAPLDNEQLLRIASSL